MHPIALSKIPTKNERSYCENAKRKIVSASNADDNDIFTALVGIDCVRFWHAQVFQHRRLDFVITKNRHTFLQAREICHEFLAFSNLS